MKQNTENFAILTRREFFKLAGLGAGAFVFFSVLPKKAQAADESLTVTINRNHGHVLSVSLQDLLENGPHEYNMKGNAAHSHTLTVTQEILDTLLATKIADVESSPGAAHSHIVRLQIVEP